VLRTGRTVLQGPAPERVQDADVWRIYLGLETPTGWSHIKAGELRISPAKRGRVAVATLAYAGAGAGEDFTACVTLTRLASLADLSREERQRCTTVRPTMARLACRSTVTASSKCRGSIDF